MPYRPPAPARARAERRAVDEAFVAALLVVEAQAGWLRRRTVANAAYLALLADYVCILFSGSPTDTTSGLVTQVLAQRVIVYSSIVNLGRQAFGLRQAVRRPAGAANRLPRAAELPVHAAREGSYQAE